MAWLAAEFEMPDEDTRARPGEWGYSGRLLLHHPGRGAYQAADAISTMGSLRWPLRANGRSKEGVNGPAQG